MRRCICLLLTAVILPLAASASAAEMPVRFADVLALQTRGPDLALRYGSASSQTAALWLPVGQGSLPRPVIVLVHGGCWLKDYSAEHTYSLAAQLASDGYAVYVPEYRRVGEAGGGWPGTAADLVRALDKLATLDYPQLSLSRTLLVGHSAGGHLALWLAGREAELVQPPLKIVAAVGLAAITDLDAYARGDNSCQTVTPRFMGASPDAAAARYREASPARRPLRVRTWLLHGNADPIVGAEQLHAMSGARIVTLEAAGHFDWIHPETPAYKVLLETLFDALSESMRTEARL